MNNILEGTLIALGALAWVIVALFILAIAATPLWLTLILARWLQVI